MLSAILFSVIATGDEVAGQQAASAIEVSDAQARASIQWLASLAAKSIPYSYHGDKDWGSSKRVWSGVNLKLDGLQLKTNRRYRQQNHGRWVRYAIQLPKSPPSTTALLLGDSPPKPTGLRIAINQVQRTNQQSWRIESTIESPMNFQATVQRWYHGTKWYSVTVEGRMQVRLSSTAVLRFAADYSELPPAFVIDPKIETAELAIVYFEVDRVSKIGGDVAEQWGELIEDVIRDRFLDQQNEKLPSKLNRSIDRNRDALRLSMADWLSELSDHVLSP